MDLMQRVKSYMPQIKEAARYVAEDVFDGIKAVVMGTYDAARSFDLGSSLERQLVLQKAADKGLISQPKFEPEPTLVDHVVGRYRDYKEDRFLVSD